MLECYIYRNYSRALKDSASVSRGKSHMSGVLIEKVGMYVLSSVAPLKHFHHNKICGLILSIKYGTFSTINNKTKVKSHYMENDYHEECSLKVGFYPLNDKTVVVEAGDTVELQFYDDDDDDDVMSCGLRLIYEDDVVDSGLVLKDDRMNDDDDDDIVMSGELHLDMRMMR